MAEKRQTGWIAEEVRKARRSDREGGNIKFREPEESMCSTDNPLGVYPYHCKNWVSYLVFGE